MKNIAHRNKKSLFLKEEKKSKHFIVHLSEKQFQKK